MKERVAHVKMQTQNQTADFNAQSFEAINYNLNKLDNRENPIDYLSDEGGDGVKFDKKNINIKEKAEDKEEGVLFGEEKIPHPSTVFDMFAI